MTEKTFQEIKKLKHTEKYIFRRKAIKIQIINVQEML